MKSRFFALVLALCMVLGAAPALAADWPPADSEAWTSVSLGRADDMLRRFAAGTFEGDAILVYYRESCGYSQMAVPQFLEFCADEGFHLYGYDDDTEGTLGAYWRLPGVPDTITFPCVAVFHDGKVTARDSVHSVMGLVEILEEAGLYDSGSWGPAQEETAELTYDGTMGNQEWEVLRLTNIHRMEMGLAPLTVCAVMQMAANQRAGELTVLYDAQHLRPDGRTCFSVLDDYDIEFWTAAENIAWGYRDAAAVVEGWLNSPGHRANMEGESLTHLGVGEEENYWAQCFVGDSCLYNGLELYPAQIPGGEDDLETLLFRAQVSAVAQCPIHGECVLPVIAAMCSGYDPAAEGAQLIKVTLGDTQAVLTVGTGETVCLEHDWDDGEVLTEPTAELEGIICYLCRLCGEEIRLEIPSLGSGTGEEFSEEEEPAPSHAPAEAPDPDGLRRSGGEDMKKLTKEEISGLLAAAPAEMPEGELFEEKPSAAAPYAVGKASADLLERTADRLSALRRIAGLPAVTVDETLTLNAQYGAVLLAATNYGEGAASPHYPNQPEDMDDDFYAKGLEATSSSNLYSGEYLTMAPDGYMRDPGLGNLRMLGHRRWQLNPTLRKVGFGYVALPLGDWWEERYVTEKVFDRSGREVEYDFIAWPASGNFPSTLFSGDTAWSVTLNPERYSTPQREELTVTLTEGSTGRTWVFRGDRDYEPTWDQDYFNVDLEWYGVPNCIIFRPSPEEVEDYGGNWYVTIEGLRDRDGQPADFSYAVDFFRPGEEGEQTWEGEPAQEWVPPAIESVGMDPQAQGMAYASTQVVDVDGVKVEFQMYALKDENGYDTNYVKLRDVAYTVNGTPAQFQVGWAADRGVYAARGEGYTVTDTEMFTPFRGDRQYVRYDKTTDINGHNVPMNAFILTDDDGNGYTYYKLRDLGQALGFQVGWDMERGVYIDTSRLYEG